MKARVLVTVASKYGSTRQISDVVGRVLTEHGVDVTVSPVEEVTSVDTFDAVVAGSAVYAGRWMKSAREFVERNAAELKARWNSPARVIIASSPGNSSSRAELRREGDRRGATSTGR